MMLSDDLLTLDQAAARLPGVSYQVVYAWYRKGQRGVKLECRSVGRKLYTTLEALDRYTAAVAEARSHGRRREQYGDVPTTTATNPAPRVSRTTTITTGDGTLASALDVLREAGLLAA